MTSTGSRLILLFLFRVVRRLLKDFKVEMENDDTKELFVYLHGPKESIPSTTRRSLFSLSPQHVEHCQKYAKPEDVGVSEDKKLREEESDSKDEHY
ncbi:hypothetical protein GW17_00036259 [Ensete ventricosum]|nr:hypothetical protein GW17_00036259 [Ensete ventricosum]